MNIEIEQDTDGTWLAGYNPLNVWAQGDTPDEAIASLYETVIFFIFCMSDEGFSIQQILKGDVDITVRYYCEYEAEKRRESVDEAACNRFCGEISGK